jgi:hypothetical protein
MKKVLVFALLFLPMTSFAASSVRVLGNKTATVGTNASSSGTAAKVVPAKTVTSATTNTGTSTSRIGTVRAKPQTVSAQTIGAATKTTSGDSAARFPAITPANSYKIVSKPQAFNTSAGTGEVGNVNVNNYYTKTEIDEKLDDPRFDMIRTENPVGKWNKEDIPEGYVFMWVEE